MKLLLTFLLCLAFTPFTVSAEGKEKNWSQMSKKERKAEWDSMHQFERQAHGYTRRSRVAARQAKNAKDPYIKERLEKVSKNLSFMADSKLEALAAEKRRKKYDWTEYQAASKENKKLQGEIKERKAVIGDKGGPKEEGKDVASQEKKHVNKDRMKKEVKTAAAPTEKKVEAKPIPKTFTTADGFMIRTSL